MSAMIEFVDMVLSSDILLYLGMLIEGIVSIFLWKKSGKKAQSSLATDDIQSLIDYHKKVADKLEKKLKKED